MTLTTHPTTTIDVRPTSGYTGAEIFGVDLSQPLDAATTADIRAALLRWKVVFFRDQDITPAQQVEFARRFGTVTPAHPTLPGLDGQPEILVVSDRKRLRAAVTGQPAAPATEYDQNNFHCDVTFVPNPPFASILRGLVVPPYGGDTAFSNLVVAYEALSAPIRELLDGLHALHNNTFPAASLSSAPSDIKSKFESTPYTSIHPVVRVHPETGERALYVNINFTREIVGLSRAESTTLLGFLYSHIAQPAFTTRFRWEANSIAFWDNRAVAHLAPGDLGHLDFDRVMHRVTLAGDIPFGPDGFHSEAVVGQVFN
jgi:alpha-ketoglutarate-dependent sulfate ester dioxygenase